MSLLTRKEQTLKNISVPCMKTYTTDLYLLVTANIAMSIYYNVSKTQEILVFVISCMMPQTLEYNDGNKTGLCYLGYHDFVQKS